MIESQKTKTAMHRVAVLFTCLLLVYLGVRWNASAMPERSPHVGEFATLSEGVFAVITLNKDSKNMRLAQSIAQLYPLDLQERTVVIMKNGSITSIAQNERQGYISNASRAHGWFWPTYLGSIQYIEEDVAKPITWRPGAIKIPLQNSNGLIDHAWTDAARGYHVDCDETCGSVGDPRIPTADVLAESDIFHTRSGEMMIHFDEGANEAEIYDFINRSAQISRPSVENKRLLDGTPYNELIPGAQTQRTIEKVGDIEMTIVSSGDFAWYLAHLEGGIVASTSKNELLDRLSTVSLTNRICNKRPVWFMSHDSSQASANNQLSVMRSQKSLRICE